MECNLAAAGGKRSAVIVGNLASRGFSARYPQAHELLARHGVEIVASHNVWGIRNVCRRVKAYVKAGCRLIVVGGGDGTLTNVVGAFAHSQSVLGILPFGTGNSFAFSLGIPSKVGAAVDVIASGSVAHVDLGVVNGRYFANFVTVGFSSRVARDTPPVLKKLLGPAAYVVAAMKPLLSDRAFKAKLRWERGEVQLRTHQLLVANGRYFGFTPVLPQATLVDGKLSIFATRGSSRWDVAKTFFAMARGKHTSLADADCFSASDLVIKTKPKQSINVDGEAWGKTPAHLSIAPRALRVMVPEGFSGR